MNSRPTSTLAGTYIAALGLHRVHLSISSYLSQRSAPHSATDLTVFEHLLLQARYNFDVKHFHTQAKLLQAPTG